MRQTILLNLVFRSPRVQDRESIFFFFFQFVISVTFLSGQNVDILKQKHSSTTLSLVQSINGWSFNKT